MVCPIPESNFDSAASGAEPPPLAQPTSEATRPTAHICKRRRVEIKKVADVISEWPKRPGVWVSGCCAIAVYWHNPASDHVQVLHADYDLRIVVQGTSSPAPVQLQF